MNKELLEFLFANLKPSAAGHEYSYMGSGSYRGLTYRIPRIEEFPNLSEVQLTLRDSIYRTAMMEIFIKTNLGRSYKEFKFEYKCSGEEKDLFISAYEDFFFRKREEKRLEKEKDLETLNQAISHSMKGIQGATK